MKNTRETIEVLNDLIQINNDRISGYEKAIRETKPEDDDLKILYATMIAESHRNKIALATEVQALGAEIEQGTTTSGKIYRTWMELKAIFTGNSRMTILANCEAVEDATQRAYHDALEHEALPSYIRELLVRQEETLRSNHEEIRILRDQFV
ncbi:MAG TPA: PA2169 family four-helix-bundle protein [Puia sp.]|nr:PA2169 family four-helix-bundle protein [Puia sp.]